MLFSIYPPDNRHSPPHQPSNGISSIIWYKQHHWHSSRPSSYSMHPAPPWSNSHTPPLTTMSMRKLPDMTGALVPTDRDRWADSDRGGPTSGILSRPCWTALLSLQNEWVERAKSKKKVGELRSILRLLARPQVPLLCSHETRRSCMYSYAFVWHIHLAPTNRSVHTIETPQFHMPPQSFYALVSYQISHLLQMDTEAATERASPALLGAWRPVRY